MIGSKYYETLETLAKIEPEEISLPATSNYIHPACYECLQTIIDPAFFKLLIFRQKSIFRFYFHKACYPLI